RRLRCGVGGGVGLQAGWYFATGAWHGYGDGALVHQALGDARYPVAIAAGLVVAGMAFFVARLVFAALARDGLANLVVALVLATGVQAGLAFGELAIRGDSTYGAI